MKAKCDIECGSSQAGGDIRVWTSISHGEQAGLCVLAFEILIRKLLAVDRLATSAL
jgi:hypothetical protein